MTAPTTTLLADCGDAVRRLAVVVPPWYFDDSYQPRLATIGRLAASLPDTTSLVVITERAALEKIGRWLAELPLACGTAIAATAPDGTLALAGGPWVQDSFICKTTGLQYRYLLPAIDGRVSHGRFLGEFDGTPTEPIRIHLEGGNCVVGPSYWLVGATSVERTRELLHGVDFDTARAAIAAINDSPLHVAGYSPSDIESKVSWFLQEILFRASGHPFCARPYQAETGFWPALRPAALPFRLVAQAVTLLLGRQRLYQPWFHLDLMVTVTGLEIAGKPALLVAKAVGTSNVDGPPAPHHAVRLDAMARRLESDGFHIIRNPVPVLRAFGFREAVPRAYNNAIVQNDPPVVWLPQFQSEEPDLAQADQENRRIWETLGFHVIESSGWSAFTYLSGALRCSVKVLGRG